MKKTLIVLSLLTLMFVSIGCANSEGSISKAQFDQLTIGMSYSEATEILGTSGELLSESGVAGGTGLDIHTVMYAYKGKGTLGQMPISCFKTTS